MKLHTNCTRCHDTLGPRNCRSLTAGLCTQCEIFTNSKRGNEMKVTLSETARQIAALIEFEKKLDAEQAALTHRLLVLQAQKEGVVAAYKRLAREISQ